MLIFGIYWRQVVCLLGGICCRNSPAGQWMNHRDQIMGISITTDDLHSSYLNLWYEWTICTREFLALGTGVSQWVRCGFSRVEIWVKGHINRCFAADLWRELRTSVTCSLVLEVELNIYIHPTCFTAMRGILFHIDSWQNWGQGEINELYKVGDLEDLWGLWEIGAVMVW